MKTTHLLAALMAVGLVACGKTEAPAPAPASKVEAPKAAEAPKPAEAPTAAPATGAATAPAAATDSSTKPAATATTPGESQPADAGKSLVPDAPKK